MAEIYAPIQVIAYDPVFSNRPLFESLSTLVEPDNPVLIDTLRSVSELVLQNSGKVLTSPDQANAHRSFASEDPAGHPPSGYAVVDLETTGFTKTDRIIEIGVVLTDLDGQIEKTYTTLINPLRGFSNTDIHGISERMCSTAPTFDTVAEDIASLLDGRVFVAHNIGFDSVRLDRELTECGIEVTHLSDGFCTMKNSSAFLGNSGRSLAAALEAAGLTNDNAHCALDDAIATAKLLGALLRFGARSSHCPAMQVTTDISPRHTPTVTREAMEDNDSQSWLSQIIGQLPLTGEADLDEFMQLLDAAMFDREISVLERMELNRQAVALGLSQQDIDRARTQYLRQVIRIGLSDSVLTDEEIDGINRVAEILEIPAEDVKSMLNELASSAEDNDVHAFALHPGDRVTFTGATSHRPRKEWEKVARAHSLTVAGMAKSTVVLVAANPDTMSSKAKTARAYKIPIISEDGFERLLHELERLLDS
ncbi:MULTISPECIES: exonuclease domain-containing protein [Corynebacterium]|uniref:exonuclease domain-containing protein n=1 Tax=Corynebacterium TaxID=1716 RepID=UPI0008A60E4B|nr:exonuclease domain-containing protein [Corynebacterium sp. HMSC073D01]MCT1563126.1 exonuclease domain-containing protein [Corynebacterium glucuronolyticum]OFO42634.1 hypothetical protein HMPREF3044_05485 [Corynebacterium sp. HMSC073D01]